MVFGLAADGVGTPLAVFSTDEAIGSMEKPPYIAVSNPQGVAHHHEERSVDRTWDSKGILSGLNYDLSLLVCFGKLILK